MSRIWVEYHSGRWSSLVEDGWVMWEVHNTANGVILAEMRREDNEDT